jgi:hypothetical protein
MEIGFDCGLIRGGLARDARVALALFIFTLFVRGITLARRVEDGDLNMIVTSHVSRAFLTTKLLVRRDFAPASAGERSFSLRCCTV